MSVLVGLACLLVMVLAISGVIFSEDTISRREVEGSMTLKRSR
jgi:hypothetical protein